MFLGTLRILRSKIAPGQKKCSCTCAELDEKIKQKAYDLYRQRGEQGGRDMDDWLEAERLVRSEISAK